MVEKNGTRIEITKENSEILLQMILSMMTEEQLKELKRRLTILKEEQKKD